MSPPTKPGNPRNVDVLNIAAAASADPRTVRKYLRGEPVLGRIADRLGAALERLNLKHLRTLSLPVIESAERH